MNTRENICDHLWILRQPVYQSVLSGSPLQRAEDEMLMGRQFGFRFFLITSVLSDNKCAGREIEKKRNKERERDLKREKDRERELEREREREAENERDRERERQRE